MQSNRRQKLMEGPPNVFTALSPVLMPSILAITRAVILASTCDILPSRPNPASGTCKKSFFFFLLRILFCLELIQLGHPEQRHHEDNKIHG